MNFVIAFALYTLYTTHYDDDVTPSTTQNTAYNVSISTWGKRGLYTTHNYTQVPPILYRCCKRFFIYFFTPCTTHSPLSATTKTMRPVRTIVRRRNEKTKRRTAVGSVVNQSSECVYLYMQLYIYIHTCMPTYRVHTHIIHIDQSKTIIRAGRAAQWRR